jgi:hypothetical protein
MLFIHQRILKANHTIKATVCGKHEVQKGGISYRENPELIGAGISPKGQEDLKTWFEALELDD